MIRRHSLLLALGIFAAVWIGPSVAEAQNDFYAHYNRYRFHYVPLSPRSAAMGGAYTALQGGEEGILGNPASLGFLKKPFVNFDFSYEEVASDLVPLSGAFPVEGEVDMFNYGIGGAYPFQGDFAGLGVALNYMYRTDDFDSLDVTVPGGGPLPASFGELDPDLDRHYVGLGAGYLLNDVWSIGYRYSYIDYDLDWDLSILRPAPLSLASEDEFSGHRNQFGVQYAPNDKIVFGLDGIFGIGEVDTSAEGYSDDADADEWAIRGGVAWQIIENIPLLLALDINYENREISGDADTEEDYFGIHFGAEYEVVENLFLRAGYQFEDIDFDAFEISEDPSISSYSTGFGYKYKQFSIDYAFMFIDTASSDMAHYVGLSYEF